jgi:hypothetical protein
MSVVSSRRGPRILHARQAENCLASIEVSPRSVRVSVPPRDANELSPQGIVADAARAVCSDGKGKYLEDFRSGCTTPGVHWSDFLLIALWHKAGGRNHGTPRESVQEPSPGGRPRF